VFKYDAKKYFLTTLLAMALIFVFASAAYAFDGFDFGLNAEPGIDANSGYMGHSVEYSFDGRIDQRKQAGHELGSGARMRQVIRGEGTMAKETDILMQRGRIQVDDRQDWVTAEEAIRNLAVTTSIKLATPPMFVYSDPEAVVWWEDVFEAFSPVFFDGESIPDLSARLRARRWNALTDQVWAVSVEANPGHMGQLSSEFEAAFGLVALENGILPTPEFGDYFNIEQHAATTDGILRRYIDISSARRLTFLHEDLRVIGFASVTDEFSLINISAAELLWHSLF
jgi:hypothetical protein